VLSKRPIFYVYCLLDPMKSGPLSYGHWKFQYEPFYIGKGKAGRAESHITYQAGNSHSKNKVRSIRADGLLPVIVMKKTGLTEKQALDLEVRLISRVGRIDLNTGPLCNWSNGGESTKGHHKCDAFKRKCSAAQTTRFRDKKQREKVRDGVLAFIRDNPERRKEIVSKQRASLQTEQHSKNLSTAMKLVFQDRSIVEKARCNRLKTWEANNSRAAISRTLGGHPIKVFDGRKKVATFDSQHQAAAWLGVWPARVNVAVHRGVLVNGYRLTFQR